MPPVALTWVPHVARGGPASRFEEMAAREVEEAGLHAGNVAGVHVEPATSEDGTTLEPASGGLPRALVRLPRHDPAQPDAQRLALRHELAHLTDLLDPRFGRLEPPADAAIRERRRALWCASVDARLVRQDRLGRGALVSRAAALARALGLAAGAEPALVQWLASQRLDAATLGALAERPMRLVPLCPGVRLASDGARERCPACGLRAAPPLAPATDLPAAALRLLFAELPGWRPDEGLCTRCRAVYLTAAGYEPGSRQRARLVPLGQSS